MAYLTDSKLRANVDLPIALPDTTIKQSDYLVVATVKLLAAQRLSLRYLTLQIRSASVDTALITSSNRIVPNLGLVYAVLRKDYTGGVPGDTGALDFIFLSQVGITYRSLAPVTVTTAGNYSLIVANNMQSSEDSNVPASTSIDFNVISTGQFRLELSIA
jgi:hypothetical protein